MVRGWWKAVCLTSEAIERNRRREREMFEFAADRKPWPSHSRIAPPGLQGVLVLFVWIAALDRVRRIESMTSAEQPEARVGLAQWLWLNGVRGEACWTWGQ